MPPHDQPWLAFSRVRWQGGLERRLVRIFDDRIEVRAGRFAIETQTIPMSDVYDVDLTDAALRIVAVPDDIVVTEGTERDRALAAELIRKSAPPPRKKPKPKPKPAAKAKPTAPPSSPPKPKAKPEPTPPPPAEPPRTEPEPEPAPERPLPDEPDQPPSGKDPEPQPVGVPDVSRRRGAVRALGLLVVGTVLAAVAIVALVGAFVWVGIRMFSG